MVGWIHEEFTRVLSLLKKTLDKLKKVCYNNYSKKRNEVHKMKEIKRGQIWYADLSPVVGSEQGGYRPVLIIQNDIGNRYSPTIIGAVITSRHTKADLPTHIWLNDECGLPKESMVECEQVRTLDKKRLKDFMGQVSEEVMQEIDKGLKISFALR